MIVTSPVLVSCFLIVGAFEGWLPCIIALVWMGLLLFAEGSCVTLSQTEMKQWLRSLGWQGDVLQHNAGLPAWERSNKSRKCQRAKNTNATRSVTRGNESVWLVNLGACRLSVILSMYMFVLCYLGAPTARLHMSRCSETRSIRADCSPLLSLIQSIGKT